MGNGGAHMRDIRLEVLPFEYKGKTYMLRCNMNVLADVQEANDGDIGAALNGANVFKSVLEFLCAMLNDYADEQGWPERVTAKQLGRELKYYQVPKNEIMRLVTDAMIPDTAEEETTESADETGN